MTDTLTGKRREILDFIAEQVRERGIRHQSVRSGWRSASLLRRRSKPTSTPSRGRVTCGATRQSHALWKCVTTPRSGAAIERRPTRHVPLVGDIAAGTNVLASENVEELLPLPDDFTGRGQPLYAPCPG